MPTVRPVDSKPWVPDCYIWGGFSGTNPPLQDVNDLWRGNYCVELRVVQDAATAIQRARYDVLGLSPGGSRAWALAKHLQLRGR